MADVFLSYSRRDAEFVRSLVEDLQDRGKSVWVDTEGIGDGEVFPAAIRSAIEGSDAFVFVITPDSAASAYCESEVDHALELQKRVVPVLREPVPDEALPEAIRIRNWIPFTLDVDAAAATERLVAALDTDLVHMKAHTRWLVKALDWKTHGRDGSFLLQGSELTSAEAWLASVGDGAEPSPTAVQREFLYESRAASSRRQRWLVGGSLTVAAISIALVILAVLSRSQAVTARNDAEAARANAQARALAAESEGQLSVDPERSILLAMEAVKADAIPEAIYALQHAIDSSPIRGRLPNVGPQPQGSIGWGPGIAYRPDGTQIAEGSQGGTVSLIDAATQEVERTIAVSAFSPEVAYSPDGTMLAVGSDRGVKLLNPDTGEEIRTIATAGPASGLQFSRDGSLLSAVTYEPDTFAAHVQVWDASSRRLREIPVGSSIRGQYDYGLTFGGAFSSDGDRMLVTGQNGLGVFDLGTGRMLDKALSGRSVNQAEYSPDGSLIVAAYNPSRADGAGDTAVEVLDARTLRPLETVLRVTDGTATVYQARFSPDGERIAFVLNDEFGVYSLRSHNLEYRSALGAGNLRQIVFSPDGQELSVTAGDGSGAIYRAGGPEQVVIDPGSYNPNIDIGLGLSGDRVTMALGPQVGPYAGKVVVRTWSQDGSPASRPLVISGSVCTVFGVDPTGAQAYVAPSARCEARAESLTTPKAVSIWDVGGRRLATTLTASGSAGSLPVFSDDGREVATIIFVPSGNPNRQETAIDLIDIRSGRKTVLRGDADCPFSAFSLGGRGVTMAAVACGDVDVWRMGAEGPDRHRISGDWKIDASPILLSPDGTTLAIANSTGAGSIAVIDAITGSPIATMAAHTEEIISMAFDPNGRLLVTASQDGTAKIWDITTGQLLRTLDHPIGVWEVVFGPDGASIATTDNNNVIRVWDACSECRDPEALMVLAQSRVTRELTADERRTYVP